MDIKSKSIFRKLRDWAEDPVAGSYDDVFSGTGKKKKDDYSDIFGGKPGEKKEDYSDIFVKERKEKKEDYSDIFLKSVSNMENSEEMIDKLTFENVTDFYFDANEKLKNIYKCAIQLTEKKSAAGQVIYCVDQYFIDREEKIIYSETEPKKRRGRTVYAKKLDEQLTTFLKQKNPFII